jgi:hypothetical protein
MGHSSKTSFSSITISNIGCKNCGKCFYDISNVNKAKLMEKLHAKVCMKPDVKFTQNYFDDLYQEKSNEKKNKFNVHYHIQQKI